MADLAFNYYRTPGEISARYEGMMIAIPEEDWSIFSRFSIPQLNTVDTFFGVLETTDFVTHLKTTSM